ncbi:phytoene/squalene synthase family protein [Parvicella tangerina]|uniref:15-cis-phytoene synthase n=1 Tax=Parvicella tangerina TaxID=2829795 RepID=A0A916NJA5_9FLAO|nr:phytoene/squalene synthase family protein [Parvicella tangerina]CAG5086528.1 15-cis-phytoene synthase [Parvicella tangerina]
MKELYDQISIKSSTIITKKYSTSFSLGIRFLHKRFHDPIYAIYGYVRVADEIVDTFHDFDKRRLLKEFRADTYKAIQDKISTNPVLNAYQWVVNKYKIPLELTDTFLDSMEMDLGDVEYDQDTYEKYILGSAEVVGLMCLKVFVDGDEKMYEELKPYAMKLGSAFQKINFLRDLKDDYKELGRTYFPGVDFEAFDDEVKAQLEEDIAEDFRQGYIGITKLPKESRFGVYVAYIYYARLLNKIQKTPASAIMNTRIRIPNRKKYALFFSSYLKHSFNLL